MVVFIVQLEWTKGLWGLKELVCQPESHLKVSWSERNKGPVALRQ